jgi:hypothetical protein
MLTPAANGGDERAQRTTRRPENARQSPWNKGKLIGSKPPRRTKDVWSILTKLQVEERIRDSAMFNLAIHSKLRGCDVVRLKLRMLPAWHDRRSRHGPAEENRTYRPIGIERAVMTL